MRLIMINTPEGKAADVARIAFSVEIEKNSFRQVESRHRDGKTERRDVVDIETSTTLAKRLLDKLLNADFYSREDFTISVRQPRAIVSKTPLGQLTTPFVEPATDFLEEFFQFSKVTTSFVARVAVAACLITYGRIEQKLLLLMIAAAAPFALVPVGFGICVVFGFPATDSQNEIIPRGASFFLNSVTLIGVIFLVYTLTKAANRSLDKMQES